MKAVNYYIVIEAIKEKTTLSGLELSETLDTDNRYSKAKIITIGNLVEGVEVDDIVYYDKVAGHGIQWKDKLYHVIKVSDIVLIE